MLGVTMCQANYYIMGEDLDRVITELRDKILADSHRRQLSYQTGCNKEAAYHRIPSTFYQAKDCTNSNQQYAGSTTNQQKPIDSIGRRSSRFYHSRLPRMHISLVKKFYYRKMYLPHSKVLVNHRVEDNQKDVQQATPDVPRHTYATE